MVILNAIRGELVYLDTNVFIYAIEGYSEFVDELNEFFNSIDAGNLRAFTSELTLAEVLVRPLMDGNLEIQTAYQQALQSSEGLEVVPVCREVLIEAARLRSVANLRLPDAIHGATAILTGCETFLTNDRRLAALPGVEVVLLSEVIEG
ncbi:MAG: type II toxin-antitoxin system VapC family toxin [Tolypothrix sp. T3-bin4]|nr:type II toxin-antitoxin system VapC family toxin [Tolypothrix sp. T3-bin4]